MLIRRSGGIGIHSRLKICRWDKACGFKSRLRYQIKMTKKRNRQDTEDRTTLYRDARWDQSWPSRCCQDLDQVEYSIVNDEVVHVAVLELTRRDPHPKFKTPPKSYFDSILDRFNSDFQGRFAVQTAERLGVEAYIIVFDADMERLWVYNLTRKIGFKEFTKVGYFNWLRAKHDRKINEFLRSTRAVE